MSLPPPPGILFGTRGKLSKLRSIEILHGGAGDEVLKAKELRQTGEWTQTEAGAEHVHLCVCVCEFAWLWSSQRKKQSEERWKTKRTNREEKQDKWGS